MSVDGNFQGSLFSNDFLRASISALPDWATLPDEAIDGLATELLEIFDRFPVDQTPNESQTEDDLIWPILGTLGWTASLRQQNLTRQGREDVPDGLLFSDQQTKDRANRFAQEWRRYGLGLAVVRVENAGCVRSIAVPACEGRKRPPQRRCSVICAGSTISRAANCAGAFSPTDRASGSTIRARDRSQSNFSRRT